MRREVKGLLVFIGAVALAAALYGLTKPDGLPWGVAAFGGETAAKGLAALPLCAVAAGLLGALFNRYFGWKVGVAAALVWIFVPGIWNGAILGEPFAAYAALGVMALFVLNAIMLFVFRKAIAVHHSASEQGQSTLSSADIVGWRGWINYLAGWVFLGAAALFAIVSLWLHDYKLGEVASVYARGIVEDAGERIIVMNGVADEQVEWVKGIGNRGQGIGVDFSVLSLLKGEEYREEVLKWVRKEWPGETNLWMAAQVSVSAFLDVATKAHPERFYLMTGESTTPEAWERRWAAFQPYLGSSDKFVPVGRRAFAYEGNAVANRLQDTDKAAAWALYGRIFNWVERGNISALINREEMLRKGYEATDKEKEEVRKRIDAFLANERNRRHVREIVQAAGPVKVDHELLEKLVEARQKRIEVAKAAGQKLQLTPEAKTLVEWNEAMVAAANKGDLEKAGQIARQILSNPQWAGWIPAIGMMGNVALGKGDYAEAEAFYRAATSGKIDTPDAIWNNYADTLMHLGKLDEAEVILRRRIAKTDEKAWPFRLTLAEVLSKQGEGDGRDEEAIRKEVRSLVYSVMKNAPPEYLREVRAKQKTGEILK